MTIIESLAAYGAQLSTASLSPEVLHHAKRAVIDWYAALLPGAVCEPPTLLEQALAIFVKVPSLDVLESRLNDRGTESEESLSRRIYKAKFEMTFEPQFDVTVLNDDFAKSSAETVDLVTEFLK